MPSTSRKGSSVMTSRSRMKRSGRTMMFAMPVSSSRVRNTKPFAVPGRWRVMTMPATRTRRPCRATRRSIARDTPRAASSSRLSAIGCRPMALRRDELAARGVSRAIDLRVARQGRRVRVAGMVITRQRPGTAKGFVFLTLEDETGIANIIVRPDLFARDRLVIVEEPFLIVDGVLQNQDGVTSVRAEQVQGMRGVDIDFDAHNFY